jgi:hypothetical protein
MTPLTCLDAVGRQGDPGGALSDRLEIQPHSPRRTLSALHLLLAPMDRYVAGEPAVYVLRSTTTPARAYVGYTTNMTKRLRRHNGEIAHGASATRTGRP